MRVRTLTIRSKQATQARTNLQWTALRRDQQYWILDVAMAAWHKSWRRSLPGRFRLTAMWVRLPNNIRLKPFKRMLRRLITNYYHLWTRFSCSTLSSICVHQKNYCNPYENDTAVKNLNLLSPQEISRFFQFV